MGEYKIYLNEIGVLILLNIKYGAIAAKPDFHFLLESENHLVTSNKTPFPPCLWSICDIFKMT